MLHHFLDVKPCVGLTEHASMRRVCYFEGSKCGSISEAGMGLKTMLQQVGA